MPRKSIRRGTATHEAGHAVAACRFGIRFDYVTIVPSDASDVAHSGGRAAGRVHGIAQYIPDYASDPNTKDGPDALTYWEEHLVMVMAGPAAQAKRQPRLHPFYAGADLHEATRLIDDIDRNESAEVRRAHHRYIETLAKEFVEKEWPRIEVVAAALVERGTLSYDNVCELVK